MEALSLPTIRLSGSSTVFVVDEELSSDLFVAVCTTSRNKYRAWIGREKYQVSISLSPFMESI